MASPGSARSWAATARRPRSLPEQLGLVGLGAMVATLLYPPLHDATGLTAFCPLRTLTGVPCPTCGMTTAATNLATGRVGDALAANPLALPLAVATACMAALMVARALGWAGPPVPWSATARRRASWAVAALVAASWVFQLHRFGWV